MILGYKIFQIRNKYKLIDRYNIRTLFHDTTVSLPFNRWLTYIKKEVNKTSTPYISGWHFLKDLKAAKKYKVKFKNRKYKLIILPILARGYKKKSHNSEVFLANKIMILSNTNNNL